MYIYLTNNPAKFHPDPIWNEGALGFFWKRSLQKKQDESNMRSVPGEKVNSA